MSECSAKLPEDLQSWLDEFARLNGRPLRILHVGNIANNAYNNAKLLNEAGLDCDVLCYDYYHSMAYPEWEDADFAETIDDHFSPDWSKIKLNGFQRPVWFAQGPLALATEYLLCRRKGSVAKSEKLWRRMKAYWYCPGKTSRGKVFLLRAKGYLNAILACMMLRSWPNFGKAIETRMARLFAHGGLRGAWLLRLFKPVGTVGAWLLRFSKPVIAMGAWLLRLFTLGVRLLRYLITSLGVMCANTLRFLFSLTERSSDESNTKLTLSCFAAKSHDVAARFRQEFPDRSDALTAQELWGFLCALPGLANLFESYDIVQAYSTDPVWPLLCGKRPFTALEHGTLREIPYEVSTRGRTTAISYRLADHVFVTNFDCLGNARQLAGDRVTLLNHPFDEDHGLSVKGWEQERQVLCRELDSEFIVFFPTRHDWVEGTGYADKANDVFLRAIARCRERGHRWGVVCCEWGANLAESRQLLDQLGVARHIKWIKPVGVVRFERLCRAAHVVADQFKLGSFGGILFKAMAVGVPVCTYLNEDQVLKRYPELPPVMNAHTIDEVTDGLTKASTDAAWLDGVGRDGRAWIKQYHPKMETVVGQLRAYKTILADSACHSM